MELKKLIGQKGLYEKYSFEDYSTDEILNLFFFIDGNSTFTDLRTLDGYCVGCKASTTFMSAEAHYRDLGEILLGFNAVTEGQPENADDLIKQSLIQQLNRIGIFKRTFICPREKNNHIHNQEYYFIVLGNEFMKIGQYPSIIEKEQFSIQKYRALNNEIYQELNAAIGLFTHGNGIGAFVYLRRIIEKHIVLPILGEMIESNEIEKERLLHVDFKTKIALSKHHLPTYLSDNPKIYSILSKGIHELTEKECLNFFTALRNAIELILDEQIALKERRKKEDAIKRELDKMN